MYQASRDSTESKNRWLVKVMENKSGLIVGMDLNRYHVQISCLEHGMNEPQTLTTRMGAQQYEIPLCMFKKMDEDVWYYGDKARQNIYSNQGLYVDDLWEGARSHREMVLENEVYSYEKLMSIYMEKLLRLVYRSGFSQEIDALVIAMESVTAEEIALLQRITSGLAITVRSIYYIDYKESFSAYATSGAKELWNHDVFLFHYAGRHLRAYQLRVNQKMLPFQVRVGEMDFGELEYGKEELADSVQAASDMDARFLATMQEVFGRRVVSTVYLIGDGFESGWMKNSLRMVCRGRRVFQGNNLFTKGACHAGALYLEWKKPVGSYASEQRLGMDVRIPVRDGKKEVFLYAAYAKEPWYLAGIDVECMLEKKDTTELGIELVPDILQDQQQVRMEQLELLDFPKRNTSYSRVRIQVNFLSVNQCRIAVTDMGLGDFYPPSGQIWEKIFLLQQKEE